MAKEKVFSLEPYLVFAAVVLVVAVSIPAYQRYSFDSLENEGLRILLEAYQEQKRVQELTGHLTEAQGRCDTEEDCEVLEVLLYPDDRFNLITGRLAQVPTPLNATTSWDQLDESRAKPLNKFGVAINPVSRQKEIFLLGVEADLDDDSFYHVLAINERGNVFLLCDDWEDEVKDVNQTLYRAYSKDPDGVQCEVESSN